MLAEGPWFDELFDGLSAGSVSEGGRPPEDLVS